MPLVAALVIALGVGWPRHMPPADCQSGCNPSPPVDVRPTHPDEIVVDGETSNHGPQSNGSGGNRRRHFSGPVVTYILDPQVRTNPATGQPCVFIGSIEGDPSSPDEAAAEVRAFGLLGKYGLCPGSPSLPAKPTPAAAASLAFEQYVHLPTPTFEIPPGYSVTGTKTFVKIDGPQNLDPAPIDALGFPVTLHIASTYDIDWGDGTTTKGLTSQGGNGYPDGDIWHVYQRTGTYTVTITQRWTATYQIAGGASGTITDPLATTGTMQLPVHEAQAVIDG